MQSFFLTIYVLVWPAIAAIVMAVIAKGFFAEWRQARREGRPII